MKIVEFNYCLENPVVLMVFEKEGESLQTVLVGIYKIFLDFFCKLLDVLVEKYLLFAKLVYVGFLRLMNTN